MELTDRTERDFYNWFILKNEHSSLSTSFYHEFLEFPIAMKYGVYVNFFDSKEIRIQISVCTETRMDGYRFKNYRPEIIGKNRVYNLSAAFREREVAIKHAIKSANEIYNTK